MSDKPHKNELLKPAEEAFLKLFKVMDYRRTKTRPQILGVENVEIINSLTCRQERTILFICAGEEETELGIHPHDLAKSLNCSIQSVSTVQIFRTTVTRSSCAFAFTTALLCPSHSR